MLKKQTNSHSLLKPLRWPLNNKILAHPKPFLMSPNCVTDCVICIYTYLGCS